jgi:hypothetical protein
VAQDAADAAKAAGDAEAAAAAQKAADEAAAVAKKEAEEAEAAQQQQQEEEEEENEAAAVKARRIEEEARIQAAEGRLWSQDETEAASKNARQLNFEAWAPNSPDMHPIIITQAVLQLRATTMSDDENPPDLDQEDFAAGFEVQLYANCKLALVSSGIATCSRHIPSSTLTLTPTNRGF